MHIHIPNADLNENFIKFFSDIVTNIEFNGIYYTIDTDIEITSRSATEYMNMMMQNSWRRDKKISELQLDDEAQNKINEFRDMFNLTEDEYPDDKILEILTENDFDDENAFSALFN